MARVASVGYLGLLALARGRPHEAREQFAAAQAMERAQRRRFEWLNVTWGLGEALLGWGPAEYERAERQLQRALAQATGGYNPGDELEIITAQADLSLRRGQQEQALSLMNSTEAHPAVSRHERAPAIYLRRAGLWSALGRVEKVDAAARFARELALQRAATIGDHELRRAYLASAEGA